MPSTGTPASNSAGSTAGAPSAYTLAGPAGQDDRGRAPGEHLLDAPGVRDDLGVDVRLAHPARDELGVLRAEVDDEDGAGAGSRGLPRGDSSDGVAGVCGAHGPPPPAPGRPALATCASASACTRRSSTNDITGTTPASTIVTRRPKPQRISDHRSEDGDQVDDVDPPVRRTRIQAHRVAHDALAQSARPRTCQHVARRTSRQQHRAGDVRHHPVAPRARAAAHLVRPVLVRHRSSCQHQPRRPASTLT